MTEWRIWRREGGMTMLHGQHREVRYAVPKQIHPDDVENGVLGPDTLVNVRSVRAVGTTEDLPESQWVDAGLMPAGAFLRLYVLEGES